MMINLKGKSGILTKILKINQMNKLAKTIQLIIENFRGIKKLKLDFSTENNIFCVVKAKMTLVYIIKIFFLIIDI